MGRKPHVLAAFPPFALGMVNELLREHVDLVPVSSLAAAQQALEGNPHFALVLCGVHFDESRMYDLLRYVRGRFARIPFVCCRILNSEIPQISREAIAIAAASLGAAAFADLPTLSEELGGQEGQQRFKALVLGQLPLRDARSDGTA